MRLDKFLKVSRIIKRRTLAKELVELGRVELDGRVAKPASEVNVGDTLRLKLRDRVLTVRINAVKEFVRSEESDSLYEVINEEFFKSE